MSERGNIPSGVVVDEPMGRALLYAATIEGLVDDEPTIGDGFVRHLLSQKPSKEELLGAFEQLVIGGKIFFPSWLPPSWKGEFFEKGLIEPTPWSPDEELIEISEMSSEFVLGMMAARGTLWSETQLEYRREAFSKALAEWEVVADGTSFHIMEMLTILKGIMPGELEKFTPTQREKYKELDSQISSLKPVVDCVNAYRRVVTESLNLNALSGLPTTPSSLRPLDIANVGDAAETRAVFKIVCKELLRVPVGETLRVTIQLATSPEAVALRKKMSEWTTKLSEGKVDPATLVLKEIEKARSSLSWAKTLTRAGEYLTWVSLPTAVVTDAMTGYVSGGTISLIGFGASAVGTMVLGTQKQIEHANRWAMYGQL